MRRNSKIELSGQEFRPGSKSGGKEATDWECDQHIYHNIVLARILPPTVEFLLCFIVKYAH